MLWYIAAGSAIGGVSRYLLGGVVQRLDWTRTFPLGTLLINVTGSFLLGVILRYRGRHADDLTPEIRAFLTDRVLRRVHDLLDLQLRDRGAAGGR